MKSSLTVASASAIAVALCGIAAPTRAAAADQQASADTSSGEIIVTARRRDETLIATPVTVTAVTAEQLSARGINNLDALSRTVPQLILTDSSASPQGGAIALRGIGAGDGNAFGDQAVAFNIDGIQVSRSTPRRFANLDIAQVQVLKGPQALYFGKNSPAGVIMIRTADPGSKFEAGISGEYEFKADEARLTGFISTPLTDSLGLRVAAMGSDMKGYIRNIATEVPSTSPNFGFNPRDRRAGERSFDVRATLKFDNGGPFTARAKITYGSWRTDGQTSAQQRSFCPGNPNATPVILPGSPQNGGPDDCVVNLTSVRAGVGTRFGTGGVNTTDPTKTIQGFYMYGNGDSFFRQEQYLAGLEMSYKLTDELTLASNTGYYRTSAAGLDNFSMTDTNNPTTTIAAALTTQIDEVSQELRLSSNFDSIINFMIGGYYQDQKVIYESASAVNAVNPTQLFPPIHWRQTGKTLSGFGSVSLKPIEQLEISGGARYSHEEKSLSAIRLSSGAIGGVPYDYGTNVPITNPKKTWNNWSPEVTATWRPTNTLTVFGGWKRGFISGGFNSSGLGTGVAVIPDRTYDQEVVEGFEGGVKAALLNNTLRVNLAAFSYKVKGLQVFSTVIVNGAATQVASNAGSATTKGVEFDAQLRTPIEGLSLHGTISYDRARYVSFTNSPCYAGQTVALGCNAALSSGVFRNQDLSGQQLVRAPEWAGGLGADYEQEVGNGKLALSVNGNYSSSMYTNPLDNPDSIQKAYWLLDASIRYTMHNGIELGLIGRNLTNTYYMLRTTEIPFTGGGTGTTSTTAFRADSTGAIGRPRELMVRLGYKF